MPIRLALISDLPALVEGASRMHAITRFRVYPFSSQKTADSFASLIHHSHGKYVFLVAENADKVLVGALIGVVEQQIFSEALTASIMHIDVVPEARMGGYGVRLIKAFEKWAKNRNALEVIFGVTSGVEVAQLSELAIKMNYVNVGGNFAKSKEIYVDN
jgi:GNAT superfamily N-acetyltransferase